MSNNNPHGQLGQNTQNPSWNPLQIPSYIPREPQLAHMSNERFMLEHQINPLLQPFVRPNTFDSMDLSLQSTNRLSNPSLNKSSNSEITQNNYGHKPAQHQQQQEKPEQLRTQMHSQNNYTPQSLISNSTHPHSNPHHHQQEQRQQQLHAQQPMDVSPPHHSHSNSLRSMPPHESHHSAVGASMLPPASANTQNVKNPDELENKDCTYSSLLPAKVPQHPSQASAEKNSPLRNFYAQQQLVQSHTLSSTSTYGSRSAPAQQSQSMLPPLENNQMNLHGAGFPGHGRGIMDYNQLLYSHGQSHTHAHSQQHTKSYTQPMQLHPQHKTLQQYTPQLEYPSQQQHFSLPSLQNQHQLPNQTRPQTQPKHLQQHSQEYMPNQQQDSTGVATFSQQTHHTQIKNLDTSSFTASGSAADSPQLNYTKPSPNISTPTATLGAEKTKDMSEDESSSNEIKSQGSNSPSGQRIKEKSNCVSQSTTNEAFIRGASEIKSKKEDETVTEANDKIVAEPISKSPLCEESFPSNFRKSPTDKVNSPIVSSSKMSPSNKKNEISVAASTTAANTTLPKSPLESNGEEDKQQQQQCLESSINANSCSSLKSESDKSGSHKTKKQQQALKIRNATDNSNSNSGTNSFDVNVAANDNAISAADELSKESLTIRATTTTSIVGSPLSPQSNSQSSSSSSSSSSCSNTTISSNRSMSLTHPPPNVASEEKENEELQNSNAKGHENNLSVSNNADFSDKLNEDKKLSDNNAIKSRFEEVENKLEEMFAGIEDESTKEENTKSEVTALVIESELSSDLGLALELSAVTDKEKGDAAQVGEEELNKNINRTEGNIENTINHRSTPISLKLDSPLQTKAAKKLNISPPLATVNTESCPSFPTQSVGVASPRGAQTTTTTTSNEPDKSEKQIKVSEVAEVPKIRTRRLTINLDRIPSPIIQNVTTNKSNPQTKNQEVKESQKKPNIRLDDERPSTSAAAKAALAAKLAKERAAERAKLRKEKALERKAANVARNTKTTAPKVIKPAKKGQKQQAVQKLQKQRKQQNSSDEEESTRTTRESSNADPKYKSPFILLKKDGNVSVINAATAEDVTEKKQVKKLPGYASERKKIRGLHSSTLSTKYDADTTDSTWICVFCKRGPHRLGLGDLFGPYLVSVDCDEYKYATNAPDAVNLDALFGKKRKREDMTKPLTATFPVMKAQTNPTSTVPAKRGRKKKCPESSSTALIEPPYDTHDESEKFLCMQRVSESSYEVWVHEDCFIWAQSVFLVGAHVKGLDAAVWNSVCTVCELCGKTGAIICCLKRDCQLKVHVPCALEAGWHLNETNLQVHCNNHSDKGVLSHGNSLTNTLMEMPVVKANLTALNSRSPGTYS